MFIFQISFDNEKGYVVSLYWFPSQTLDEFDSYNDELEKLTTDVHSRKGDFVMIIGDFNTE